MKLTARKKTIFWKPKSKRRILLSVLALAIVLAMAGTAIGVNYHQRKTSQLGKPASSDQLTAAQPQKDGSGVLPANAAPQAAPAASPPGVAATPTHGSIITHAAITTSGATTAAAAAATPAAVAPQTASGSTVPEKEAVSDDYFNDAVFVGDSRTQGLMLYAGLDHATFYANKGLNVNEVFDKNLATVNGRKVSIADALSKTSYSKVYIMLGINELGWVYPEKFSDQYAKLIDTIQSTHPNAVIYLEGLLPVTAEKSAGDPITNNEKIDRYNVLIAKLAKEKKVNYLNVREAVQDANGNLCGDATTDGVHLNKAYCVKWLDYLKTHTI